MNRKSNKIRYLMSYGHFCSDFVQGVLTALLPFLIRKYGFSYARASSFVMVSNLVGSLIQPLFGYIADKKDNPGLMTLGVLAAGTGMAFVGLAPGYVGICIAVVVSGIGVAMYHPQGARVIDRISDENNKGTNMGIFSFGGNLGFTLGPVTASAIIGTLGLGGSVTFLIPAVVFAILMLTIFRNYEAGSRAKAVIDNHLKSTSSGEAVAVNRWGEFLKICGVVVTRSIVFAGCGTFMILIMAEKYNLPESTGSTILSCYYAVQALSSLGGGKLADRIGFRRTLILAAVILFGSVTCFALSGNIIAAIIFLLPMGVGSSLGYSSMVSLGQKFLPGHIGFASGITLGLSVSTGGIVAPFLGRVGDIHGLTSVYYILAAVALLVIVFSVSVRETDSSSYSD